MLLAYQLKGLVKEVWIEGAYFRSHSIILPSGKVSPASSSCFASSDLWEQKWMPISSVIPDPEGYLFYVIFIRPMLARLAIFNCRQSLKVNSTYSQICKDFPHVDTYVTLCASRKACLWYFAYILATPLSRSSDEASVFNNAWIIVSWHNHTTNFFLHALYCRLHGPCYFRTSEPNL